MGPLSFLRVVDCTDLRGALCGRILADLGADVILVSAPGLDDAARAGSAWQYRNANKRGCTIDLAAPDGARRLAALLDEADVVIDNGALAPAIVASFADRPRLVHVALRDFGLHGPRAGWVLEPLTALAASGTMFATGFPTMAPCGLPGFLAHDCASVYGAIGAVAAVADRGRHGRGQVVEVSVQEAALAGTTPWSVVVRDYLHVNPHLPAAGTRNADGSYWVLPAADGWVRTVIGSRRQWDGFVELLGSPDTLTGPEWNTPGFRLMNADVVRICAEERLTDRTRQQLFAQAMHTGATFGVLHTPSEFVAHPQTIARGLFATGIAPFPDAPFATTPFVLSRTPAALARPAPAAGDAATFTPRAGAPAGTATAGELPRLLDGVRVVEFGMAAVVPELCGVLSELGAEVVKVESRAHPDVLRSAGGRDLDQSFAFNAESRGRASVAIDLSTDEGRAIALDLCVRADVVAENYRGGVLDRLGLGVDAVRAVNPGAIVVTSQGYGRTGPYAEVPAYGPLNAGFAGLHHRWSARDAPYPCGTSLNHPDHIAGKLLAVAVLAALAHRDRTGEGQHVDMAQTDAAAYLAGEMYLDAARTGDERAVCGNESPVAAPHGVYPAAGDDRWLALVVPDDATWARLVAATGWVDVDDWSTAEARRAARAALDAHVAAWTSTRAAGDAAALLQAHGVSAMPVMGPDDHRADPHLAARAFLVELQHPKVGVEHHVGNPLRMSRTEQRAAGPAPCLGADTHDVLARWLGRAAADVDDLVARGVCA